jgi:hypothetical protein
MITATAFAPEKRRRWLKQLAAVALPSARSVSV